MKSFVYNELFKTNRKNESSPPLEKNHKVFRRKINAEQTANNPGREACSIAGRKRSQGWLSAFAKLEIDFKNMLRHHIWGIWKDAHTAHTDIDWHPLPRESPQSPQSLSTVLDQSTLRAHTSTQKPEAEMSYSCEVLMCVCDVQVCMHTYACSDPRGDQRSAISHWPRPPHQVLSKLGYLSSRSQRCVCLCLPITGVTTFMLFKSTGSGTELNSSCLQGKHSCKGAISSVPL